MLRRLLFALLITVSSAPLVAPTADATTMRYADTAELTAISDTIVEGTVLSYRSYIAESGNISTDWTIAVSDVWLGDVGETVTFTQMGGEVDGRVLYVPGDAVLEVGAEVVLFMRTVEGRLYLSAMGQSMYTVDRTGLDPVPEIPSDPTVGVLQVEPGSMRLATPPPWETPLPYASIVISPTSTSTPARCFSWALWRSSRWTPCAVT